MTFPRLSSDWQGLSLFPYGYLLIVTSTEKQRTSKHREGLERAAQTSTPGALALS